MITRSRDKAVDVWEMKVKKDNWFILETNYDHWKAPMVLDDRRTPANKCMKQKGQKVSNCHKCIFCLSDQTLTHGQSSVFPV